MKRTVFQIGLAVISGISIFAFVRAEPRRETQPPPLLIRPESLASSSLLVSNYKYDAVPGGKREILLSLVEPDASALARIANTHEGERLEIVIDDVVVHSPRIKGPLDGREVMLSFDSDESFEAMISALEKARTVTAVVPREDG